MNLARILPCFIEVVLLLLTVDAATQAGISAGGWTVFLTGRRVKPYISCLNIDDFYCRSPLAGEIRLFLQQRLFQRVCGNMYGRLFSCIEHAGLHEARLQTVLDTGNPPVRLPFGHNFIGEPVEHME